jgi:hypothetical protein
MIVSLSVPIFPFLTLTALTGKHSWTSLHTLPYLYTVAILFLPHQPPFPFELYRELTSSFLERLNRRVPSAWFIRPGIQSPDLLVL